MSVCFHWSNKSLYVEVPLIFMLVNLFILYFSALLPFWDKAISRVLHASSKQKRTDFYRKKILPNFWLTAILTTSVLINNTEGKLLEFHSFFDFRDLKK